MATKTKKPTAEELAAARALIASHGAAERDDAQQAMVDLVTSADFIAVEQAMRAAQAKSPAEVSLSYAVSMFDRLRTQYTPA